MELNKQIMKGNKARGALIPGSDLKLLESPKIPPIKDFKAYQHPYQISGKPLFSSPDLHLKETGLKLPPIKQALQEQEDIGHEITDSLCWKNQKQDLKRCIGKQSGNSNK